MVKMQTIAKVLIILLIFIASGCEPLRKKFTRQKKKDESQSAFIPVLDPVDYPDKVETPEESYRHYFSLWQVWDKDFMMRLQENSSDKKINFTFNQVLLQLTEMEKLLTGEKQQKIREYIGQLTALGQDLKQPAVSSKEKWSISGKISESGFDLKMFREVWFSKILTEYVGS